MLAQYWEIKQQYPHALLFFRVGDFFEMFGEDAEIAARELDIQLTKKSTKNFSLPMAGVPAHAYDSYLSKLVKAGYKVAICEQLETPAEAKKAKKSVVTREVVRVVTAGTATEESIIHTECHNYLAALYTHKDKLECAWLDISTGDFYVESGLKVELPNILARINPKEILAPEALLPLLGEELKQSCTLVEATKFNYLSGKDNLVKFFEGTAFSDLTQPQIIVGGVLLGYLLTTQNQSLNFLKKPQIWHSEKVVRLDFFTRRSLELDHKLSGERKGALLDIIKRTCTKAGSRLLNEWLAAPLVDVTQIEARLKSVEFLLGSSEVHNSIIDALKNLPDVVRLYSKLSLGRGGPQDLCHLKIALSKFIHLRSTLALSRLPKILSEALLRVGDISVLHKELSDALKDLEEIPIKLKSGGFLKAGYKPDLAYLQQERKELKSKILGFQSKYTLLTGVNSLKLQYNNILGYFIEVNSKHANILLTKFTDVFMHRQTLANVARFTTQKIIEDEAAILKLETQIESYEERVFKNLLDLVISYKEAIFNLSTAMALADVLSSFALLAQEQNYVKPKVDNSAELKIIKGRHPAVEKSLQDQENSFTANDCVMTRQENILLLTGPNMAGKSTYLRQNAIIIILAQIGSYVPAESAHIGVVDAVFSRVGAADNLYKGQSTFMVEMVEAATILNNATCRSFIILDEIGRGTATYDGLALAYGVIHYAHQYVGAKLLFATHYHELTALEESISGLRNFYMRVDQHEKELIFMHNVLPGVAGKSYGIYAAQVAGMPKEVLQVAAKYLKELEASRYLGNSYSGQEVKTKVAPAPDLSSQLLPFAEGGSAEPKYQAALDLATEIGNLQLDELTPRDAQNLLYEFYQKAKSL